VAAENDLSIAKSEQIVHMVFDSIAENVADKKAVRIKGFGSFTNRYSKERSGVNPATGKAIKIPAKQRVKFTAYKSLKDTINK